MPKFCGLRKKINCLIATDTNGEPLNRIRFGVSSSGSVVSYDIYGEPIEGITDYKNELTIYGVVDKTDITNDDNSDIGGRPMCKRTVINFITSLQTDIQRNDVVEYPLDSNEFYRITFLERASNNLYYVLKGSLEIRE